MTNAARRGRDRTVRTLPLAALLLATTLACAGDGRPPPATPTPTTTGTATTTPPAPTTPPPALPRSMAALGDSITRAFLVCPDLGDCPDGSWATGTFADVESHRARLAALAGRAIEAHNLAVSGAVVSGLAGQVRRAIEARPEYVTILIGANDACTPDERSMTPAGEFERAFRAALDTLVAGLPRARVLVVSVPDLLRLWEIGKDDARVREVWRRYTICQSMLADPAGTGPEASARRQRVHDRVAAYNDALARACARHAGCRFDGNAVFEHDFTLADVSPRDYWHPSRAGQRTLADVSWRAGFWG